MPAAGEDRRFVVFGALDYASGRLLWQVHPKEDGAAFVAFLDHLAASFPDGQVVAVLDNGSYKKAHAARHWWVEHQARIRRSGSRPTPRS